MIKAKELRRKNDKLILCRKLEAEIFNSIFKAYGKKKNHIRHKVCVDFMPFGFFDKFIKKLMYECGYDVIVKHQDNIAIVDIYW